MNAFEPWLRELRAASKGPVDLPAATRGVAWSQPVELEGDWTGSSLSGGLRISPDAPDRAVEFTFTGPVVANGLSVWTVSLTGAQTAALPADTDMDGVTRLPFSFDLDPAGSAPADVLLGGTFILLGRV